MGVAVSFQDYTPPPRFDAVAWTDAQIEEAATETGTYTVIDTVSLGTPDVDPANPAARNFTTVQGTADDQWYRVVFLDALSTTSEPTLPVQNTSSPAASAPYATVEELAKLLKVDAVARVAPLTRVLTSAAEEIDAELGRDAPFTDPAPALVVEVNLERAVEHWQQMQSPFGIIGLGADLIPVATARDSWERHAQKLAPLKVSWGIA